MSMNTLPLRHELKYFINERQYFVLSGVLDGILNRDPNGDEYNEYHIRSLYFDTAFAARRIEIPVMIGVGFIDPFCTPSAVYTIYNELKGPKFMLPKIKNGHGDAPPEYGPMTYLWLSKQINN